MNEIDYKTAYEEADYDRHKLFEENQQLKKERASIMTSLTTSREKYNNDKARYRRKYKNLKKQKNDVVKAIKGILEINNNYSVEKLAPFYSRKWLEDTHTDLLIMLGEIDNE
jgi:DNA-binding helix-hairpin-helix protein with protein kinase domain